MVLLPKLMYCFFSSARASLPMSYRRNFFPGFCALRYLVYVVCISFCCAITCSHWAALTPAARAAAAYAPGLAGALYTQTGSAMTMQYFSLGMMHARYPFLLPLGKWVDFRMVNAPLSLFLRVSLDSGVMISVIFVMGSFWAKIVLYAQFLTISMTSLLLCFWRGRMYDVKIVKISKYPLNLWLMLKSLKRISTNYETVDLSYG